MQPKIDCAMIGQRIKMARLEKGLNQSDLGAMIGCSNNHMSHIEVGQTKVSLALLMKLAFVLDKDFNYFLYDTSYVRHEGIIDSEIAEKLKQCDSTTLLSLNKIIDVLLEYQEMIESNKANE